MKVKTKAVILHPAVKTVDILETNEIDDPKAKSESKEFMNFINFTII